MEEDEDETTIPYLSGHGARLGTTALAPGFFSETPSVLELTDEMQRMLVQVRAASDRQPTSQSHGAAGNQTLSELAKLLQLLVNDLQRSAHSQEAGGGQLTDSDALVQLTSVVRSTLARQRAPVSADSKRTPPPASQLQPKPHQLEEEQRRREARARGRNVFRGASHQPVNEGPGFGVVRPPVAGAKDRFFNETPSLLWLTESMKLVLEEHGIDRHTAIEEDVQEVATPEASSRLVRRFPLAQAVPIALAALVVAALVVWRLFLR